jgi:2-polyprenyl-3-methyl-5-hydroxy-6-metoxy-1,4-benzoquinol methylase
MKCSVCTHGRFERIALKARPFVERNRFSATLFRCINCGFVQQNPSTQFKKFLAAFYSKEDSYFTAPPSFHTPSARTSFNLSFLRKHMRRPVRSILEIGCYDGYFLDLVRKTFRAKEAVGIEIIRLKNNFPKVQIFNDFYPSRKIEGKKFDLIVVMNVLEHVFSPREFMLGIKDNLHDEGKVVIEVPNEAGAFTRGMLTYQYQHISYFTPTTMRRFLASLGFKIDVLYTKDADRLFLICSRAKRPIPHSMLKDKSALGYTKRSKELVDKFKKMVIDPGGSVGLYGASNFTHYILQVVGRTSGIRIFDGDERKVGKYISDITLPIQSWQDIDSSGIKKLIIMPLAFTPEIYAFLASKKLKTPILTLFEKR